MTRLETTLALTTGLLAGLIFGRWAASKTVAQLADQRQQRMAQQMRHQSFEGWR